LYSKRTLKTVAGSGQVYPGVLEASWSRGAQLSASPSWKSWSQGGAGTGP